MLGVLALAASGSALAGGFLEEIFEQGKAESKRGSYGASLETFQRLDEASRQPGNEAARAKLEPLIAFYRGVNLAALGRNDAARKEFETYLASFPSARLDPAAFPRAALDVFNSARENVRGQPSVAAEESGIAQDYARFRPEPGRASAFDQGWTQGAIRHLMTKEETAEWDRLTDPRERGEFVTRFWQGRDPDPRTPENEFRDEIERRLRFADARFGEAEKRGRETDRGLVFVLLGPPSYIAQKPLRSEDDSIQAARNAPAQEVSYDNQGRRIVRSVPRDPMTAETLQGTREVWYYRRDRLPQAVRFPEVDFEFITRKGIGTAVLQREHDVLVTLDLAARASLVSP